MISFKNMRSFKKWYLPIISVVFLLVIFLKIFAFRDKRIPQSIPAPSERSVSRPYKDKDNKKGSGDIANESPSFSKQLALLGAPWGRDPFSLESLKTRSYDTSITVNPGRRSVSGKLSELTLTGIVFFDNHYMALINNTGVREGDKISGFRVLKIKRDYIVLLDSSGDYYTLELK